MSTCSLTCAACGQVMAAAARSLPQGQAKCQPCRRRARSELRKYVGGLVCALCAKPIFRSPTSLPQGQAQCQPCRRLAAGRRPDERWRDVMPPPPNARNCATCSRVFTPRRQDGRYCSKDCSTLAAVSRGNRFRTRAPRNTTAAGYGTAHQRARRAAAQRHRPTDLCVRCGQQLGPMGSWLHYDHNAARTGYLGFAHARCNSVAGAREGRLRQFPARIQQRRRAQSRDWWGVTPEGRAS